MFRNIDLTTVTSPPYTPFHVALQEGSTVEAKNGEGNTPYRVEGLVISNDGDTATIKVTDIPSFDTDDILLGDWVVDRIKDGLVSVSRDSESRCAWKMIKNYRCRETSKWID